MAKYIEESYLLNALGTFSDRKNGNPHFLDGIQTAREVIADAPAADVAPVVHAHWIEQEDICGDTYYTCSNCKCDWTTIDGTPEQNNMKYCPECGAKMDGKGE